MVLVAGMYAYTFAQTATPVIKEQQENQHDRIQNGVRNDSLNRREVHRLRNIEKETHHDIKEAKADGVVTPKERVEIKHD